MDWGPSLILPLTDVKQRLPELLKKVQLYQERITITKSGVPAALLLGLQEFESLCETIEILSDPKIMRSLRRSRAQARKGKFYLDHEVWE